MKILILNSFFNHYDRIPSFKRKKYFIKFYKNYSKIKLRRLVKEIKKEYDNDLKIKIITTENEKFNIYPNVEVELLSNFRMNFDRKEFRKITEKITIEAKKNLITVFNNLKKLKTFHFEGLFFGKLFELNFIDLFNKIFREFELLKLILQKEDYDRAIIFNYNSHFSEFVKYLYSKFTNIEVYQDSTLKKINNRLNWYIFNFLFYILKESFKRSLSKKQKFCIPKSSIEKSNIIFYGPDPKRTDTSHYKTMKPIYDYLKTNNLFNPVYYRVLDDSIPLKIISKLIKTLIQVRKNWLDNHDEILINLEYESLKLDGVLKEFYQFDLFFSIIICFIRLYHFKQFIKYCPPKIVVLNDTGAHGRVLIKNCKKANIPTISIPICANPIFEEIITQSDLNYITVSGEKEKDYFMRKGEPSDKIIVTGRPVYEKVYKGKFKKLSEVKDMFDNRIYKFEPDKITIVLNATIKENDKKILKNVLSTVFNSLKRFNLQDNLILKLHPMENGQVHKELLKDFDCKPIIIRDVNIFELLKSCNIYLTRQSTTIIEAMIVGTPIIVLDLNNLTYEMEIKHQYFEDREFLMIVENEEELSDRIQKLINEKDFIENYSKKLIELSKGYSFFDENNNSFNRLVELFFKIIE